MAKQVRSRGFELKAIVPRALEAVKVSADETCARCTNRAEFFASLNYVESRRDDSFCSECLDRLIENSGPIVERILPLSPDGNGIPVTEDQFNALMRGEPVVLGTGRRVVTLGDGPFRVVDRHYGPGVHPGTGTDQQVHAGDGKGVSQEAVQRAVERMRQFKPLGDETPENASWFAPDGEPLAFGEDHQFTAVTTLKDVEGVMLADIDAVLRLVEQYGFVRHTTFENQHGFWIPPKLSDGQQKQIVAMMDRAKAEKRSIAWYFSRVEDGGVEDIRAREAAELLGLAPDFYEFGLWAIRHMGPGDHPSGSPQQVHAGDEVETVTQDEFQATLERSRRARELFRKLEPDMDPRRSKTFQNFIAANVARLLDTDAEMKMEIIDEVANHRGLVIRTKDGNSLDIQMGLIQSLSRYGENEIIMSWIAADQKGTGLGTAFMKSMWQYSKKTGTPFRVIEVTNDAFYQKFSWLETIQTQATSAAGEYLYDPKKDAVERVDEDDPEEYDLTESPHHPDGKRWPPKMVERHYGPGPHPGTGSPQGVHAGDGGESVYEGWPEDEILAAEEEIADLPHEVGIVFSREKRRYHQTNFSRDSVDLSDDIIEDLELKNEQGEDVLFLHNHPDGGTLSPTDIGFALKYGVDEMVVVTEDRRYRLSMKREFDDVTDAIAVLAGTFNETAERLEEGLIEPLSRGQRKAIYDGAMDEAINNMIDEHPDHLEYSEEDR